MSYLNPNTSAFLNAKLTNIGRQKIAQGNFNISYFQIGDSEFDYTIPFNILSGDNNVSQKIISPINNNDVVKYPYLLHDLLPGSTTGVTIGTPIMNSYTDIVVNPIGAAGMVSGTTVKTAYQQIPYSQISSNVITLTTPTGFTIGDSITLIPSPLNGNVITASTNSNSYIITGASGNNLYLNRNVPNYNTLIGSGNATIINNDFPETYLYEVGFSDPQLQQDAWNLNVVWNQSPIGTTDNNSINFESAPYVSSKEFFGYTSSNGQLTNTGTTITDAFGNKINVLPEDQHSIAIVHFSKTGDTLTNIDKPTKYDDYIYPETTYFQVYLPFILYERNLGSITGATFTMGDTDYFINSSAIDSQLNKLRFRYLKDELGKNVGKVFVDNEIIIFDDQELVAVLDQNTNRNYTLPIPKIDYVPSDIKCQNPGEISLPLLTGNTTNKTYYVTYSLEYTGDTAVNSLPCNHYCKITGTTIDTDISIKFNENDFKFMKTGTTEYKDGYIANKFYILLQKVDNNDLPDPNNWVKMDFTDELSLVGGLINPADLNGTRFIIDYNDFTGGTQYVWGGSPLFGKNSVFPGSIKVKRATNIEVMRYFINLPNGEFSTTQNPTYSINQKKYITEVKLLDNNYNIVVSGKFSRPLERTGSQVISVKIDI